VDFTLLYDNELLYAEDLLRIQEQAYSNFESTYGLIGEFSGLLTDPGFRFQDNVIEMTNSFLVYVARTEKYIPQPAHACRILQYENPFIAGWPQTIDTAEVDKLPIEQQVTGPPGGLLFASLAVAGAPDAYGVRETKIWVRQGTEGPNSVEENRKFWSGMFGQLEQTKAVKTRSVQTLEFKVAANEPISLSGEPWVRIASVQIDSATKHITNVVPSYVWDLNQDPKEIRVGANYTWLFDDRANRVVEPFPIFTGTATEIAAAKVASLAALYDANQPDLIDYSTGSEDPTHGIIGILERTREQIALLMDGSYKLSQSRTWLYWGHIETKANAVGVTTGPGGEVGLTQIAAKLAELTTTINDLDITILNDIIELENSILSLEKRAIVSAAFVNPWIPEVGPYEGGEHTGGKSSGNGGWSGGMCGGNGSQLIFTGGGDLFGKADYTAEWCHGGDRFRVQDIGGFQQNTADWPPYDGPTSLLYTYLSARTIEGISERLLWRDWSGGVDGGAGDFEIVGYRHRRDDPVAYATIWQRITGNEEWTVTQGGMEYYSKLIPYADAFGSSRYVWPPGRPADMAAGLKFPGTIKDPRLDQTKPVSWDSDDEEIVTVSRAPNFEFMCAGHGMPSLGTQKSEWLFQIAEDAGLTQEGGMALHYFYSSHPDILDFINGPPTGTGTAVGENWSDNGVAPNLGGYHPRPYNPPQDQDRWATFGDEHLGGIYATTGEAKYALHPWGQDGSNYDASTRTGGVRKNYEIGCRGLRTLRQFDTACSYITGHLFYSIDSPFSQDGPGEPVVEAYSTNWDPSNTGANLIGYKGGASRGTVVPPNRLNFEIPIALSDSSKRRYGFSNQFNVLYEPPNRMPVVTFSYPVTAIAVTPVPRICNPLRTRRFPSVRRIKDPDKIGSGKGLSQNYFDNNNSAETGAEYFPGTYVPPTNHIVEKNHYYAPNPFGHKASKDSGLDAWENEVPSAPFAFYVSATDPWAENNQTKKFLDKAAELIDAEEINPNNPFGAYGITMGVGGSPTLTMPIDCAAMTTSADWALLETKAEEFNQSQTVSTLAKDQGWNTGYFNRCRITFKETPFGSASLSLTSANRDATAVAFFVVAVGGALAAMGGDAPPATMSHHARAAGTSGLLSSRKDLAKYIETYFVPYSAEGFITQGDFASVQFSSNLSADKAKFGWKEPGAAVGVNSDPDKLGKPYYNTLPWVTDSNFKDSNWEDPTGYEWFPDVEGDFIPEQYTAVEIANFGDAPDSSAPAGTIPDPNP